METLCMAVNMVPEVTVACEKTVLPFVIAVFLKMSQGKPACVEKMVCVGIYLCGLGGKDEKSSFVSLLQHMRGNVRKKRKNRGWSL